MNNKIDKWNYKGLFIVFLGILAVVTIVIQIVRSCGTITQTEVALFGILQFLFSTGFAWYLAKVSSKREFEKSQRQFAISAYRRIREIEKTTFRLVERSQEKRLNCDENLDHELDVIQEVSASILASSRASISDWADIIGDEISTVEELEKLRNKQLYSAPEIETNIIKSDKTTIAAVNKMKQELSEYQTNVDELLKKLPTSLQVVERDSEEEEKHRRIMDILIRQEMEDHGSVVLDAFWAPDSEFDVNPTEYVGKRCQIRIGNIGTRNGGLFAFLENGMSFGVVTNKSHLSNYNMFAKTVINTLENMNVKGTIISIGKQKKISKRIYFKIRMAQENKEEETKEQPAP